MENRAKKMEEFIENLQMFSEDSERIDFLISYADKFKKVPDEVAQKPYAEENKVPFCESGAYVFIKENPDKTLKLYFDVENPQGISAMALAAILDSTLSGEKPENISSIPEDLVYKVFGQGLSMGKNMGLSGMVQMVQREAKKHEKK